jgi:hypothetical protein
LARLLSLPSPQTCDIVRRDADRVTVVCVPGARLTSTTWRPSGTKTAAIVAIRDDDGDVFRLARTGFDKAAGLLLYQ